MPYWNELRRDYADEMDLMVFPYFLRNSWNMRAEALGISDGVVSRAFGNTEATNLRAKGSQPISSPVMPLAMLWVSLD